MPTDLRPPPDKTSDTAMSRRSFLRGAAAFSGLTALAASLSPLRDLADFTSTEQFLQKYYKELTPDDMSKVIAAVPQMAGKTPPSVLMARGSSERNSHQRAR